MIVQARPPLAAAYGIPTPEEARLRERLLAGSYFLVRIAGNGDVWRCRRCHAKHSYLTLMCTEQPFSGLTRGLYAYYKFAGDSGAVACMDPFQRARFERLSAMFGQQPDLATSHPQTARALAEGDPMDMDAGALALGILEPIPRSKAAQLARAINARGCRPAFTLPGIEPG